MKRLAPTSFTQLQTSHFMSLIGRERLRNAQKCKKNAIKKTHVLSVKICVKYANLLHLSRWLLQLPYAGSKFVFDNC